MKTTKNLETLGVSKKFLAGLTEVRKQVAEREAKGMPVVSLEVGIIDMRGNVAVKVR